MRTRFGRWLESESCRLVLLGLAGFSVGLSLGLWAATLL